MFELQISEAYVFALAAMLAGIYLLIRGGDWTVDSSVFIAERFGISPMLVGFTIIAMGTSLPEMVVSLIANMQGSGGIAIGNVLGSNIANILLVIGATAMFVPLATNAKAVYKDLIMMLVATGIFTVLLVNGDVLRWHGIAMIVLLLSYIVLQYKMNKDGELPPNDEAEDAPEFSKPYMPYVMLFLGLIAIAIGAEFLVRGAKLTAELMHVPEAVIALSLIALGTSLPELSTCIIAGRKGHSGIVIGNIIGSNVFNILMIIGVTATVKPILQGTYAQQLVDFDIWLVLAISVIFTLLLVLYNKVTRPIGAFFVLSYIAYNIYIYAINYIG